MKAQSYLVAALACATTVLAACHQPSQPQTTSSNDHALGPDTIAAPGGTQIPESLYRYYAENVLHKSPSNLSDQERSAVLDNLSSLKLLADAAKDQGLSEERTIAVQLELQEEQFLARAMISRYLERNPATESEIQAAYQERLPSLGATQFKARHILLKTEDEAKSVIKELDKGADFAELAKTRSTDPSGTNNGGDLGWFTAASTVKPFSDAVQAMKVGTYTTEPVHTEFGWHVILLEDRKEDQPPGLEAVREEMTTAVNQKKVEAYIASLREKSGQ